MNVTPEFKEASTRAAIRGLRGLEQTAIMLETYAPEVFPEVNDKGQKHFGRIMMESAAEEIRKAWTGAIVEVEAFPDNPASIIEQRGKLRQALFEIATVLTQALSYQDGGDEMAVVGNLRSALNTSKEALASGLVK